MTASRLSEMKQCISIAADEACDKYVDMVSEQLEVLGYRVIIKNSIDTAPDRKADLEVILTDFSVESQLLLDVRRKNISTQVPIIFISNKDDFDAHHKAVQYGGLAFIYAKNIEEQLFDAISVALTNDEEAISVLIVDDDADLAEYHQLILESHHIEATVAHNAKDAFKLLKNTLVDIVLLDINMPDCDGFEFATMLRQLEEYVSLPIIFVSTEESLNKVKAEHDIGADDFLAKPVSDKCLLEAVKARAARTRVLRQFMIRDSATMLLNHTSFKKELGKQVARCQRQDLNFSYVLLDLDRFKNINDSYGHTAGDIVLKSFSHLLRTRLRNTDIIGRYGGEEFAVIFLDTETEMAKQVVDELLEKFSHMPFQVDGQQFFVSFSGGIADYKSYPSASSVVKAADAALYQAKDNGRAQVVIADGKES